MSEIDAIIPVRDVDDFLSEAIDSCLNQVDVTAWVTVVDAGSSTPVALTPRHRESGRVTLVRSEQPLLAGGARNMGIASTSRDVISFLDADDVWPVDRSAQLLSTLRISTADLAIGQVMNFGESDSGLVIPTGMRPAYLAGGVVMPRSTFTGVGLFDENLRVGEFIEWYNRFNRAGYTAVISPEVVLHRRIHRSSTTVRAASERRGGRDDYLRVVREWMNRNG